MHLFGSGSSTEKRSGSLASGYVKIANWNMAIEIVDLSMKSGDFPVRYVNVYQMVFDIFPYIPHKIWPMEAEGPVSKE